jgi:ribonuclease E
MRMIMPSHAKQVVRYDEQTPLFAKYQVESYLGGMFNPVVQLKSGGYIVIGITEALVAIDVNSGRATKEGSIEDTALKTNLEAAEEISRQLRLRDLAGLIVIDFIDMEERRNNLAVEKRLKDKLKTDRARIQVGRISGFGLLEMSRQRLRPGMLESTTQPCAHCHGTGLIRSDDSLGLQVLRALEEEGTRKRSKEVLLRAPVGIVNFLINQKREHLALIEARYGMAVRIEADPAMISPDFSIEKFKTATRFVPEVPVVSGNASLMGAAVDEVEEDLIDEDLEDELEDEAEAEGDAEAGTEGGSEGGSEGGANGTGPKKKRRRRRKKKPAGGLTTGPQSAEDGEAEEDASEADAPAPEAQAAPQDSAAPAQAPIAEPAVTEVAAAPAEAPVAVPVVEAEPLEAAAPEAAAEAAPAAEEAPAAPKKPTRARASRAKKPVAAVETAPEAPAEAAPAAEEAKPAPKKPTRSRAKKPVVTEAAAVEATAPAAPEAAAPVVTAPVVTAPASVPADPGLAPAAATEAEPALQADPAEADDPSKPKRKGWWSVGR